MSKELLIFVGHSADAKTEVEAVCTLESEFQKFLRRHVKNIDFSTTSVKMFIWENDADTGIGGQKFAINPYLESADIALFIFKERVGKVTWEELQYCRENHIRTIAIFPAEPPYPDRFNEEIYVDQWMDLIKKKKSLTENWSAEDSDSITPVDPYKNLEDLKGIVREKISDLIPDVVFKQIEKRSGINNDAVKIEIQKLNFDLNNASGTNQYSSKIVLNYRSKLRDEYKLKYPDDLNDIAFLTEMEFIKNDKLTLAGILLFTDKPSKYLRSAIARASKYEGKTKSSSKIRMDIDDSIINQILLSREFIENNIESRDVISDHSSESQKIFKYPMKCIREVLANALCHRDYSDNSRFVYITIYDDRIEISNPGEWGNRILPEGKSILFTELQGRPVEKNFPLTRAISAINFMEMEGSGISTAVTNCIEEGAPVPQVIFENGYVAVTILPRKNWDVYNLGSEVRLGELDEPVLLDKKAAKIALKAHLNFVKKWSKEMNFGRGNSPTTLAVDVNLSPNQFKLDIYKESKSLINASELLSLNQNCVILGSPGSGKTTAIKILANKLTNSEKRNSKYNFPVLILLREFNSKTYFNFYIFLAYHLGFVFRINGRELNLSFKTIPSQSFLNQIKKQLIQFFEENKILLMLDGLDEIPDNKIRRSILKDIEDLSYDFKKCKILLTSRTGTFEFQLPNFNSYGIAPLSDSQIDQFAKAWLGENAGKFLEVINYSGIFDNFKNPLLLTNLLSVFEWHGSLPTKPNTLYRATVYLLLEEWDMKKGVVRDSIYSSFEVDRKFDFLTAISFSLTSKFHKSVFSRSDLQSVYESIAEKYYLPKYQAASVVSELESTTGLFVKSSFDTYEFSHKSIQEYLCAEYMGKRPNSWDSAYLNLPNELAIAVGISSDPSFNFINIVRHIDEEILSDSQFVIRFINRIVLERIDFQKSVELALSFYYLLTKIVSLDKKAELDITIWLEERILTFSSPETDTEIMTMYENSNFEELNKKFEYMDFNSIKLPGNFRWYSYNKKGVAPEILKRWPELVILPTPPIFP